MKQVILIITLFAPMFLFCQQNITGKVIDINKKGISNAKISYKTFETFSDTLGNFRVQILTDSLRLDYIIISHENYLSDSVMIDKKEDLIIQLKNIFSRLIIMKFIINLSGSKPHRFPDRSPCDRSGRGSGRRHRYQRRSGRLWECRCLPSQWRV